MAGARSHQRRRQMRVWMSARLPAGAETERAQAEQFKHNRAAYEAEARRMSAEHATSERNALLQTGGTSTAAAGACEARAGPAGAKRARADHEGMGAAATAAGGDADTAPLAHGGAGGAAGGASGAPGAQAAGGSTGDGAAAAGGGGAPPGKLRRLKLKS